MAVVVAVVATVLAVVVNSSRSSSCRDYFVNSFARTISNIKLYTSYLCTIDDVRAIRLFLTYIKLKAVIQVIQELVMSSTCTNLHRYKHANTEHTHRRLYTPKYPYTFVYHSI